MQPVLLSATVQVRLHVALETGSTDDLARSRVNAHTEQFSEVYWTRRQRRFEAEVEETVVLYARNCHL